MYLAGKIGLLGRGPMHSGQIVVERAPETRARRRRGLFTSDESQNDTIFFAKYVLKNYFDCL